MLIWITIQVFQYVFNAQVQGEVLDVLRVFGFLELMLEIFAVIALVITIVWAAIDSGSTEGDGESHLKGEEQ